MQLIKRRKYFIFAAYCIIHKRTFLSKLFVECRSHPASCISICVFYQSNVIVACDYPCGLSHPVFTASGRKLFKIFFQFKYLKNNFFKIRQPLYLALRRYALVYVANSAIHIIRLL